MTKNTTKTAVRDTGKRMMGLDLGDPYSDYSTLDAAGENLESGPSQYQPKNAGEAVWRARRGAGGDRRFGHIQCLIIIIGTAPNLPDKTKDHSDPLRSPSVGQLRPPQIGTLEVGSRQNHFGRVRSRKTSHSKVGFSEMRPPKRSSGQISALQVGLS